MNNSFDNITEMVRINKSKVSIRTVRLGGKEGDFFVYLSESLNVSGYGKSKEEAEESFQANMKQFCVDLTSLSLENRDKELRILGFVKTKFQNKNFSKTYVDGNGELQGFEEGTVEKMILETVM
ncbi:MAG: hypothetical protein LH615_13370 [Ferruginibacter sp.]|nr:hypothetical protein [Ferruginibacter sp.]